MTGANPQVFATDTQPLDGRASLQYVVGPDVQATAAPQTRFGVSASVIKNARGLGIDLHSTRRRELGDRRRIALDVAPADGEAH